MRHLEYARMLPWIYTSRGPLVAAGLRKSDAVSRPGEWDLFGAKVRPDELPDEAMARGLQHDASINLSDFRPDSRHGSPRPFWHSEQLQMHHLDGDSAYNQ